MIIQFHHGDSRSHEEYGGCSQRGNAPRTPLPCSARALRSRWWSGTEGLRATSWTAQPLCLAGPVVGDKPVNLGSDNLLGRTRRVDRIPSSLYLGVKSHPLGWSC